MDVDERITAAGRPPDFRMDGLWAALSRLDQMLERAAAAAEAAVGTGASEPYRGLYITSEDVRRLVRRAPGAPLAGEATVGADPMPSDSRFPWLARTFGLEPLDLDVVLLALAPEIDLRYERLFAYLQDDVTRRRASLDLALNLLCASREAKVVARGRVAPHAPLLAHRLLQLVADPTAPASTSLSHALKLDDAVVRFLTGHPVLDPRAHGVSRLAHVAGDALAPGAAARDAAAIMTRGAGAGLSPHFYLHGAAADERAAATAAFAEHLGRAVLAVDLARVAATPDPEALVEVLFRDALLHGAMLHLANVEAVAAADRPWLIDALDRRLRLCPDAVVISGAQACPARFTTATAVAMREPDFRERRAAWLSAIDGRGICLPDADLDQLAARYALNDAQIRVVVDGALRQTALEAGSVAPADLARAARQQVQRDPGTLARRITPLYVWRDLVLPPDQVAQLQELCRQARHRHVVYGDWGFDRKLSHGKGLSALFSGPPGTGKTMAAEVIANDLGLDLFKIDLSQVVSKYIGETEKHLDRLFAEARAGSAILFFDECDALFGKRTTVQDAHDRYANIEIAYLLQKLEEHDGLSILASNLRENLDVAFTRRLSFIVEFPFPDDASRRRIWDAIWPRQAPLSHDLDLEFMATQFKVAGGAVKNIAVAAAFLAAEDRRPITTEHVLRATRRELEKGGRRVSRSEFGRYGAVVAARPDCEVRP